MPGDCGSGIWWRGSSNASASQRRCRLKRLRMRFDPRLMSQARRLPCRTRSVLALLLVLSHLACTPGWAAGRAPAPVSAVDSVAITVSDADRAVEFYSRVLTFEKVADREVAGEEYEHLFGVFGLRAAQGPGVELLEYLTPRTGRAMPPDTQANDLWYWQIDVRAPQPAAIAASLQETHAGLVSSQAAQLHDVSLGWRNGGVAHDPDGHGSLIVGDPALADAG